MTPPCENCNPLDQKKAIRDELMKGRFAAALLGNKLKYTEMAHFVDQIMDSLSKSLGLLDAANIVAVSSSKVRDDMNSAGNVKIGTLGEDCKNRNHGKRVLFSPCNQVKSRSKEDGYKWNKYGEKEIKGFTHKRSYFCCSHKGDQGCNAKRQVQIAEDDNSVFIIKYTEQHTCKREFTQGQSSHSGFKNQSIISFESSDYSINNIAPNSHMLISEVLSDMKPDHGSRSEYTMMMPNPEIDEGFLLNMGMTSDYSDDFDLDPFEYMLMDEVPPLPKDYYGEMSSFDEEECSLFRD